MLGRERFGAGGYLKWLKIREGFGAKEPGFLAHLVIVLPCFAKVGLVFCSPFFSQLYMVETNPPWDSWETDLVKRLDELKETQALPSFF